MNNIVLLALLYLFSFGISFSQAQSAQVQEHKVVQGETLFAISKKYDVSIDDIKKWNNLTSNELKVGTILKIRKAVPPKSATQAKPSTTPAPAPSSGTLTSGTSTHIVAPKETLFSISKQYGLTVDELKQLNQLKTNELAIGQELIVLKGGSKSSTTPSEPDKPFVSKFQAETAKSLTYTVQRGDNLIKIASQFGMTIEQIKNLNQLTSNTLGVGQLLQVREAVVPPSIAELSTEDQYHTKYVLYEVSKGESARDIALKFEMDMEDLALLNTGIDLNAITVRQKVLVLKPGTMRYRNPYSVTSISEGISGEEQEQLQMTFVSVYTEAEEGKVTTSGDLLNNTQFTAAHSSFPLNAKVVLQHPGTGKSIIVTINDRITGKGFKLTKAAYERLLNDDTLAEVLFIGL